MITEVNERRYQVFVSSTFVDLQEERQKVLQAILELKAFPAGMELFPSADDDQWDFIKREIDSSDYYVVIIAGKYGSLANDGLSYTEKEYDYAVEIKKPVMAFLSENLDELKGRVLEADPLIREKLERFHQKAKRGKLVRSFNSPDDLKSKVLMSLVHSFQMKPAEGWVRAKNARRIEDLEDLASLQKKVLALERENEALRSLENDELNSLAQGKDKVIWDVVLRAPSPGGDEEPPPIPGIKIEITWDNILWLCFLNEARVEVAEVKERLAIFAQQKLKKDHKSEWFDKFSSERIAPTSMRDIVKRIHIQFMGLAYIDIEHVTEKVDEEHPGLVNPYFSPTSVRREYWSITRRGASRYALIAGQKKRPIDEAVTSIEPTHP